MNTDKDKVLISFCNPILGSKAGLLVLDIDSENKTYLLNTNVGVTGLAQDEKYIYVLNQISNIYIFNKETYSLYLSQKLDNLIDPHSLIIENEFLYIVSTGNDQVLKYRFDEDNMIISYVASVWKPDDSNGDADTHHINSIFKNINGIFISAFGKKDKKWSSAKNGYILNINTDKKKIEKIYHPHSLSMSGKDYYYCESSTRSVIKNTKKIITLNKGYVRGLAFDGRYLLLGTSSGRKNSKSTGEVNNPAEDGILEENCKLLVYKKNFFGKYKFMKEFDFSTEHQEIYDIIIMK